MNRAVYKLGYLLETPLNPALLVLMDGDREGSDNVTGAANQQERLDMQCSWYPESPETIRQAPSRNER